MSEVSWERMFSSDAPTWMYVLSRIAFNKNEPLSDEFFSKQKITNLVKLYAGVNDTLKEIKKIGGNSRFKKSKIEVHQFIITAGLKEYVEKLVPKNIFSYI